MTSCSDLDQAVLALPAKVPAVVVKCGSRGARVYLQNNAARNNAAASREVVDIAPLRMVPVDTIGAGDSFDAGFLRAYLQSKDIVACAHAGNITGALSTQAPGGTEAFRDSRQRENFLREHHFFELFS
jgi:sugar/nucleoside kinase (ribokinase family)